LLDYGKPYDNQYLPSQAEPKPTEVSPSQIVKDASKNENSGAAANEQFDPKKIEIQRKKGTKQELKEVVAKRTKSLKRVKSKTLKRQRG